MIVSRFFVALGALGQSVASRATCLRGGCCLLSQIIVFV